MRDQNGKFVAEDCRCRSKRRRLVSQSLRGGGGDRSGVNPPGWSWTGGSSPRPEVSREAGSPGRWRGPEWGREPAAAGHGFGVRTGGMRGGAPWTHLKT